MIEINIIELEWFHVISEPGDATRYDFLVTKDYDNFLIVPYGSSFKFPQRINKYDIKANMNDIKQAIEENDYENLIELCLLVCNDEQVNCWTVVAVCKAIVQLYNLEVN